MKIKKIYRFILPKFENGFIRQERITWRLFLVLSLALIPTMLQAEATPKECPPFQESSPEYAFKFPRDHGAHNEFQTEWWYFTGQFDESASALFAKPAQYGFQLTFFRRGQDSNCDSRSRPQIFLAHAALTDVSGDTFQFSQRLATGNLGVAGSKVGLMEVWNRDWKAEMIGEQIVLTFSVPLKSEDTELRLVLTPEFPPVAQGVQGFSKKGTCASCASHYYSYSRMSVKGEIRRQGIPTSVKGLSWMDHEFMSNALQSDQIGWDWFSVMLKDSRELMVFKVRSKSGPQADFYSASIIEHGKARSLDAKEIKLQEVSSWKSPRGEYSYPSEWKLEIASENIQLHLKPLRADQELYFNLPDQGSSAPNYWEGAVRDVDGKAIGYVEMTGYHKPVGDI